MERSWRSLTEEPDMDKSMEEFLSLFTVDAEKGTIHLMGERMAMFNTEALGLFRKELIETLGLEKSRHVLTRIGYLFGQHDCEKLKQAMPESDPLALAGVARRLASLQGVAGMEDMVVKGSLTEEGRQEITIEWENPIEGSLQLKQLGPSEEPSCSMMTGYASGYGSALLGRRILFIETECVSQGADRCRVVGRSDEAWGDEANLARSYLDPIDLGGMLRHLVETVEEQKATLQRSEAEISQLRMSARPLWTFTDIIGESHAVRQALSIAERAARFDTTILIQGESGTGKEMLARGIHRASGRKDGPFLAVNCGALTETLLESELFGYRRGAFTGAERDYEGLFRAADGGSILLDEISEISPALQVKLLRVLQEKEVRPVGSSVSVPVDVRVIAATNRDLQQLVLRGRFRDDLFYRLNVIAVRMPALRERENDVLLLADHFVRAFASRHSREVRGLTPEARRILMASSWPGNVRQLQNAIERAVVLGDSPYISVDHLPGDVTSPRISGIEPGDLMEVIAVGRSSENPEAREILALLARHGGSRTRAARALGVARSTLWRRMKRLGLN
jgi:DNA-binding NtrC family response regulator/predicted hydrocarbon binding protein